MGRKGEKVEEVAATPAAEDLAKKEGVDLTEVEGSGAEGRVLVDDVRVATSEDTNKADEEPQEDPAPGEVPKTDISNMSVGEAKNAASSQAPGGSPTVDPVELEAKIEEEGFETLESSESYEIEEVEYEDLGFEERLPWVHEGMWVRLKPVDTVEARHINRDLAVVDAPTRRSTGPSTQSNSRVEYQLPTDAVHVRNRDTGEDFEVARGNIAAYATDRGDLGGSR